MGVVNIDKIVAEQDIIDVPAHSLGIEGKARRNDRFPAFVYEIYYKAPDSKNPDASNEVSDLLILPIMPKDQAKRFYPGIEPITLTAPSGTGLREWHSDHYPGTPFASVQYVVVPKPEMIKNTSFYLGTRDTNTVNTLGMMDYGSKDHKAVMTSVLPPDHRDDKVAGHVKTQSERFSDFVGGGVGSQGTHDEHQDWGVGKRRATKLKTDLVTYDLSWENVIKVFQPSEGLSGLFKRMAKEKSGLTLKGFIEIAETAPDAITKHLSKPAITRDSTIESLARSGRATKGLAKALLGFVEAQERYKNDDLKNLSSTQATAMTIHTVADLLRIIKEDKFYGLSNVGSNEDRFKKELTAILKEKPDAPTLGYKDVVTQVKGMRDTFMKEAPMADSPSASAELRQKYSDLHADGQRHFFHKIVTPKAGK